MPHVEWTRLFLCHSWNSHMHRNSTWFTLVNTCIIMHGGYLYIFYVCSSGTSSSMNVLHFYRFLWSTGPSITRYNFYPHYHVAMIYWIAAHTIKNKLLWIMFIKHVLAIYCYKYLECALTYYVCRRFKRSLACCLYMCVFLRCLAKVFSSASSCTHVCSDWRGL